nr:unnamed protein product [Callosobruchus chinensis]
MRFFLSGRILQYLL